MTRNKKFTSIQLPLLCQDNDDNQNEQSDVSNDNERKIDFILVYTETNDVSKNETRQKYEQNLKRRCL